MHWLHQVASREAVQTYAECAARIAQLQPRLSAAACVEAAQIMLENNLTLPEIPLPQDGVSGDPYGDASALFALQALTPKKADEAPS